MGQILGFRQEASDALFVRCIAFRLHHALQKKLTAFDTDADKVENQNGKVGTEVFTRPSSYILKIKIDESICRFMHHIFID